jgi:hypothetical protein
LVKRKGWKSTAPTSYELVARIEDLTTRNEVKRLMFDSSMALLVMMLLKLAPLMPLIAAVVLFGLFTKRINSLRSKLRRDSRVVSMTTIIQHGAELAH